LSFQLKNRRSLFGPLLPGLRQPGLSLFHPNAANDHAVRAKALENRVESVYREALADLFQDPEDLDGVMEILKLREIYRHLSNAADRGDQAANVIGDIVVKWL
jgi:uncharacterized protein